jgi:hypothetical protein
MPLTIVRSDENPNEARDVFYRGRACFRYIGRAGMGDFWTAKTTVSTTPR